MIIDKICFFLVSLNFRSVSLESFLSNSEEANGISQVDQSKIEYLELALNLLKENVAQLEANSRLCAQSSDSRNTQLHGLVEEETSLSAPLSLKRPAKWRARRANDNRPQPATTLLRGEKGEPGRNGLDGVPGLDGAPGLDGIPGIDGRNGRDGTNGRDGKDGKDGLPGERGPVGPPGLTGNVGRRGKMGPTGKTGPPGSPGICAYQAKFDCDLIANSSANPLQALLIAPTMIGQEHTVSELEADERQVTVKEGDNIQLSCEAFGLPKPEYVWLRFDAKKRSSILLDALTNLQVTSFLGGQLPLFNVSRLQAGSYECIASNGIKPNAVKRIILDVNYAPTIRLYPSPSIYRSEIGPTSILLECIVEANPSSFSYWMFGSNLIMTIAPTSASSETNGAEQEYAEQSPSSRSMLNKKYIITESTGQLSTGAYYSILSLNITDITRDDFGVYKCISKNLIGQTIGYVLLENKDEVDEHSTRSIDDRKLRETILDKSWTNNPLDQNIGWPEYLIGRGSNYTTFGAYHARLSSSLIAKKLSTPFSGNEFRMKKIAHDDELQNSILSAVVTPFKVINSNNDNKIESISKMTDLQTSANKIFNNQTNGGIILSVDQKSETFGVVIDDDPSDEIELCRIEKRDQQQQDELQSRRSSNMLLDKIGKPVYLASVTGGLVNWWSLDSKQKDSNDSSDPLSSFKYYVTSSNYTDTLFRYENLADLLKDQLQINPINNGSPAQLEESKRFIYKLNYPLKGNSHLIYGGQFFYTTQSRFEKPSSKASSLNDLRVVELTLRTNKYRHLRLDDRTLNLAVDTQPLDLSTEYKMNRIELASDENGVWLILPTIESKSVRSSSLNLNQIKPKQQEERQLAPKTRRLHVLKLRLNFELDAEPVNEKEGLIEIDYHVSMKLDWRMIGQMFIIDGVLYGIKDRHLYSSKLQFAYDLYKCKLLSTEYLNEPHRTFTNHFGDTQMIKYNPNEPKRLYTIDNGNLLWCPVKLIKTNPDDIWQTQYTPQQYLKQDNSVNNETAESNQ